MQVTKSRHIRLKDGALFCRGVKVFERIQLQHWDYNGLVRAAKSRLKGRTDSRMSFTIHDKIAGRKPGSIVKQLVPKRVEAIRANKAPEVAGKHYGIEIEFVSTKSAREVKEAFAEAGLHKYVTYHSDGSVRGDSDDDNCDGSCRDNCECSYCDGDCSDNGECPGEHDCECSCTCSGNGHEVCVLVKESELEPIITKVCGVLNSELDARVNKTCGLHVHLDARSKRTLESRAKMYNKLATNVMFLASLVPKSRRTNSYCRINDPSESLESMLERDERYYMINPTSLKKHKTIEVRAHSGTTDPTKIINWVKLLRHIAYWPGGNYIVKSFEQLASDGLELNVILYFVQRYKKFYGESKQPWVSEVAINHTELMSEYNSEVA
jgi:hypothetical protein